MAFIKDYGRWLPNPVLAVDGGANLHKRAYCFHQVLSGLDLAQNRNKSYVLSGGEESIDGSVGSVNEAPWQSGGGSCISRVTGHQRLPFSSC